MYALNSTWSLIFSDARTTLVTLFVGYVAYLLAKFYVKVFSLPPGPIPVPLLGNILKFRGTEEHWSRELEKMASKYGPVFTFWLGNRPVVIIDDIDIARDAFRKNEMTGRPKDLFFPESEQFFANDKRKDITLISGHNWEALRRVAHSAVLKYSVTDKLSNLVTEVVDHTVDRMLTNEGLNKSFAPFDYVYNMFLNILAASAFGKRYDLDDPEYKFIKYAQKDFLVENTQRIFFWQMSRVFRWWDRNKMNELRKNMNGLGDLIETKFKSHYKDYDEAVIRDFCDALISAKKDALKGSKESAPYLTDGNLSMAVMDLFFAGTDTSQVTFRWCLLHMLYNKEIQIKLRREVEAEIGDRIPTHEDRNRCHYVMAFISETLRLSNIIPNGVHHMALVNTKLGDHSIDEGTEMMVFQGHILHQAQHWDRPYEFIPDRFLDSEGHFITTRPKAFIPFGVGRRICVGEKMAIADLFLVVVRFLQKTADYEISLHCDSSKDMLSADPNNFVEYHPKHFEMSFRKK